MSERNEVFQKNKYIMDWVSKTKLHILKPTVVQNVYKNRKEIELFHIYTQNIIFEYVRRWKNANMKRRRQIIE